MNKQMICTAIGAVGSFIASIFGGWDTALVTLLIFMAVDYITGLLVAGVFQARSLKTERWKARRALRGLSERGLYSLLSLLPAAWICF